MIGWLRQNFPWLVIGGAFAWSALAIVSYRAKEAPAGTKIVLRIAHWQLEAGVREAFCQLATDYHQLHPEVYIVQDAIPEQTYGQWLTTQLMGGTASDMIEIGLGLPAPIWIQYQQRYFVPLTPWVNQPNPYNAGGSPALFMIRKAFVEQQMGYACAVGIILTLIVVGLQKLATMLVNWSELKPWQQTTARSAGLLAVAALVLADIFLPLAAVLFAAAFPWAWLRRFLARRERTTRPRRAPSGRSRSRYGRATGASASSGTPSWS